MKKFLFTFVLFGMLCQTEIKAEVEEIDPIENKGNNDSGNRPKGISRSINSSVTDEELLLSIDNYLGQVQVMITSDNGMITNSVHSVIGHGIISIDFANYSAGLYSVALVFPDGTTYTGSYRVF